MDGAVMSRPAKLSWSIGTMFGRLNSPTAFTFRIKYKILGSAIIPRNGAIRFRSNQKRYTSATIANNQPASLESKHRNRHKATNGKLLTERKRSSSHRARMPKKKNNVSCIVG